MPTRSADSSIDLDGDGVSDNRFAYIVGLLGEYGIPVQVAFDNAVSGGRLLQLLQPRSYDAAFSNDPDALAFFLRAADQASPMFNGAGAFEPSTSTSPDLIRMNLSGGVWVSGDPAHTRHPIGLQVPVVFGVPSLPVLTIALAGARLRFSATDTRADGEIQGSIRSSDVTRFLLPYIDAALNNAVRGDPNSPVSTRILMDFDVGGCMEIDGSSAKAHDGTVSPCELLSTPAARDALSPDLQIFRDKEGLTYGPVPGGIQKDSLSFGVGFSAVTARFEVK